MSRRHLSFVAVAIASLVISACNASPTGPRPATSPNHDTFTEQADSVARIGTTGSTG